MSFNISYIFKYKFVFLQKYSTASKSKSVNDGFALRMTPINRASNLELMKEKSIDEPGFSMLY